MRSRSLAIVVGFVLAGAPVLLAQDPVKVAPTNYKVILENASVRVLEVSLPPGTKNAMHQHPDVIVVALAAAKTRFTLPDGKTVDSDMAVDSATYQAAGTHSSANIGTAAGRAIVVEFKGAGGKATLPTSRPGMTIKPLAEGPRGMAYRSTTLPDFSEPAGTKHDYDQVVIAVTSAQVALSIDGKPTKTTWARGDVVFVPRNTAHEAKNTGGKAADIIIVAIK
jgi:quercetin dioxygenase-like cupin family protein